VIPQDTFQIKLPQFEGPFDLLLFFIERDELDIHNIPIARISDDFLSYIQQMNALNIELASEFIFVAATLMRIKAKMLLPRADFDEEGNEIDLKKDLVSRLIEYRKFKQAAAEMQELEASRFMMERRGSLAADLQEISAYAEPGEELASVGLYRLMWIYERAYKKYRQRSTEVKHVVVQYPYTIEKQKQVIADLIRINQKMDFTFLKRNSENRVQFVYNFLAMLEMLQQQLLTIQLGSGFNNFWVREKEYS
jgi:segregation and condensation protein A